MPATLLVAVDDLAWQQLLPAMTAGDAPNLLDLARRGSAVRLAPGSYPSATAMWSMMSSGRSQPEPGSQDLWRILEVAGHSTGLAGWSDAGATGPVWGTAKEIIAGRVALEQEVLKNASVRTQVLGIEILDFQFKRTNYADIDRPKVYERMISERKRIAEEYRSEGAGEAARISGSKDRDLKEITSEAYRQAQELRGKADAEAADIYAGAYNRDPDFYRFLKTMEVYRTTLDSGTILMLSTQGEFLRYLEKAR